MNDDEWKAVVNDRIERSTKAMQDAGAEVMYIAFASVDRERVERFLIDPQVIGEVAIEWDRYAPSGTVIVSDRAPLNGSCTWSFNGSKTRVAAEDNGDLLISIRGPE